MATARRERAEAAASGRPVLVSLPGVLPWEILVTAYACGLFAVREPVGACAVLALVLWLTRVYGAPPLKGVYPAFALILGFVAATLAMPAPAGPEPEFVAAGRKVALAGEVAEVGFRPGKRLEILLRQTTASPESGDPVPIPGLVALTYEDPPRIPAPGDRLAFVSRLRDAGGFANFGSTGRFLHFLPRNIHYAAFAGRDTAMEIRQGEAADTLFAWRLRLRALILGVPEASEAPGGPPPKEGAVSPGRGVVLSLLMGDRFYLGAPELDRVRRATLTHTLALSGLHLGFVAAMGWMLAYLAGLAWPKLYLRIPRPKLAVLCAAPLVCAYLWLGQFTPSLVRAAVMFAAWGVLLLCNRGRVLIDGLFLAAAAILAVSPLAVFDVRLQLSVLAVAGIAWFLPLGRRIVPWRARGVLGKFALGAWELLWLSLCAQLGVLPIILESFGEVSPHLAYNLLWVPVMGFAVMPAAFFGLILALIPAAPAHLAGQGLLSLASVVSDGFLDCLVFLDRHGLLEAAPSLRPAWPETLGFFVLLAALAGFLATGRRSPAVAGVGLALLMAPAAARVFDESRARVSLTMLDVGQGQALVVTAPGGGRALVDGGGFRGDFDVGRLLIAPELTDNAPPRLAALVMTHPDRDHALGLMYPLESFRIGRFDYSGDAPPGELGRRFAAALARSGLTARPARVGESISLGGGVALSVLHPAEDSRGDANERSVVLRLTWNGRGLALLTGDTGRKGIGEILARGGDLRVSALVAPHHGSAKSAVPGLYDLSRPGIVLASAGRGNQWGFPTQAVREQAARLGAILYATSESGALRLTWDDPESPPRVEAARSGEGPRTLWPWAR